MQQKTIITERTMGVAALASLTAGIIAGIGARIIMRIVALTSHMPTTFSILGTLVILLNGLVIGLIVGFVLTCLTIVVFNSPKASKFVPGRPIQRGLIYGILLLIIVGPPLFLSSSFPNPDINFGIPLLNKSMFGALMVIYGITLGVAEKTFDHFLPRKPTSTGTDIPTSVPTQE